MERLHTVKCSNGYDYEMPIYDWSEDITEEPVLPELLKIDPTTCWNIGDNYYAFNYVKGYYEWHSYIVNSVTKKIEWTLPSMFEVLVGEEGTPITPDELRKALL